MRRLLFIAIALLIFVGIVGAAASYRLVQKAPYLPGNVLFPLQAASEQMWGLGFNGDARARADTLLVLLSRRLDDLTAVQGTPDELTAVAALDRAYAQAITAVAAVPPPEQQDLQLRLDRLAERILVQLVELNNADATAVHTLRAQIGEPSPGQTPGGSGPPATAPQPNTTDFTGNRLDDPRAIPFPPGANLLQVHSFFPLTGGHSDLACSTCHTGDTYSGAPAECIACHAEDDTHQGLYGSDCASCHTSSAWQKIDFNHDIIGTQDCIDCHTPPKDHYAGTCRACHIDTTNFNIVFFDHSFIGDQDCAACHTPPANHYAGTCRACHIDTSNFSIVFFDHSFIGDQDCAACHLPPANHYPGTCSACHQDTSNFRNAFFNHAGLTDCAACHAPPANHFPGQCSNCHNTNTFTGATFNHTFPVNHGDANNQCETCHPGNNTQTYTCYTCHNQQEMANEHSEEGIGDISNCVRCHPDGREHDD
ncbi:MAG: hypothetical protein H6662_16520 [Ardenticatenaceae bacterium]|nr:hypothetical protein [Ardenticatenaceae bacterium]MCB9004862.1 hypothetical protein [Ardenticatenaceae bacterium]